MSIMGNVINTAKFREKLPAILKKIQEERKPVVVGRFGEPKAVLVDVQTYSWQQQVLNYLTRLDRLSRSEIETLEILLDAKTRNALLKGLAEIEEGETIDVEDF